MLNSALQRYKLVEFEQITIVLSYTFINTKCCQIVAISVLMLSTVA